MSIILPGVDDEILDLARSLKVNIDAVADPNFRGNWDNYKTRSDANLLEIVTPTGVIIAIDSPQIKKRLDQLYNTKLVDLIGGDIHRTSKLQGRVDIANWGHSVDQLSNWPLCEN